MNFEVEQRLLAKIRQMPMNRVLEVEDFIDFLNQRDGVAFAQGNRSSDQALIQAATELSEPSFARIWDNPEDTAYDNL